MSTRKAVYLPEKFYAILKGMAELDCRPMGQQIGWLLQQEQARRKNAARALTLFADEAKPDA